MVPVVLTVQYFVFRNEHNSILYLNILLNYDFFGLVLGARATEDDELEDHNKKGNNIRYPVLPDIQRRTHQNQIEYVKELLATGNVCKGVKGVSPMFGFPGMDVVNSFPVDDLHCCYIGVNYLLFFILVYDGLKLIRI
jgi:hypothetical protein